METQLNRAVARYTLPESEVELLARYGSLVHRVGRRLAARFGMPRLAEELWSVGALGLLDAARRFDQGRAVRFETFAEHRIRGAMLDELRRSDHLPRRLRADVESVERARQKLRAETGEDPQPEAVAAALGVDLAELAELEQLRHPLLDLESARHVAGGDESAEARLERQATARRLEAAVGTLPPRLQLVLSLYYVEELTLREIARVLEVSEARVCQLHKEALERLRPQLASE